MTEQVVHKGSCHCGKVIFSIVHAPDLEDMSECNCSICAMKGRTTPLFRTKLLFKLAHTSARLHRPRHQSRCFKIFGRQGALARIHIQYRDCKALVLQNLWYFSIDGPKELSRGIQHQLQVSSAGQCALCYYCAKEWAALGGINCRKPATEALRLEAQRNLCHLLILKSLNNARLNYYSTINIAFQ